MQIPKNGLLFSKDSQNKYKTYISKPPEKKEEIFSLESSKFLNRETLFSTFLTIFISIFCIGIFQENLICKIKNNANLNYNFYYEYICISSSLVSFIIFFHTTVRSFIFALPLFLTVFNSNTNLFEEKNKFVMIFDVLLVSIIYFTELCIVFIFCLSEKNIFLNIT